ncbi:IclR family transcriptional regulator [Dactylosporangium siamense]|uniref:IclR family transcriptional regulator n=1 Tax=Dactylosporangium siamense TaxID=685454 RepID=A0A919PH22_9ACTN|nr:IclR family transcriptional regulator [Dactylosporangium siamense]GIG43799.1 IclR family transcriptional regulator [Dactylosporangium siamense]
MTVIAKVAVILDAFTAEDRGVGFAELQRRTGLAKATLHRLTGELVAARLLERVDGRFHLSGHLFALGMRASVERGLIEVATPFLEDLYERTHETVHLGLREGAEVVYVAKIGGHRQARAPSRLGGRMPLHATAIGKALLAFAPAALRAEVLDAPLARLAPRTVTSAAILRRQLDEAVRTGVAFEAEESAVGIVCVGAPVLDGHDVAVAAVSVAGPATRFDPRRHAAAVKAAAAGVTATLARREALLDQSSV